MSDDSHRSTDGAGQSSTANSGDGRATTDLPSLPASTTRTEPINESENRSERLQRLFAANPTKNALSTKVPPTTPPPTKEASQDQPQRGTTPVESGTEEFLSDASMEPKDLPASSSLTDSDTSSAHREAMVRKGVQFLQSPTVKSAPWEKKKAFLLGKGLTDAEITLARERAHASVESETNGGEKASLPLAPLPQTPYDMQQTAPPPLPPRPIVVEVQRRDHWLTWKMAAFGLAGGSVALTGLVALCQRRVIPLLLRILQGRRKRLSDHREAFSRLADKMDSTASTIPAPPANPLSLDLTFFKHPPLGHKGTVENEVLKHLGELSTLITASMYGSSESQVRWRDAIDSFRGQVRSIKGGLLSRRNFPMYPPTASDREGLAGQ